MSDDPLRTRDEAAVHGYRATGDPTHLDTLRQDGLRDLAHALTMERWTGSQDHTDQIEAWLKNGSTGNGSNQERPGQ